MAGEENREKRNVSEQTTSERADDILVLPRAPLLLYGRVKVVSRISSKHQVTLPVESLERAGLKPGDEVAIEAEGPDRIIVRRAHRDPNHALGVFDGLYEVGYLERLRARERA